MASEPDIPAEMGWPTNVLLGAFAGIVIALGIGMSQLVATGLAFGVRIGLDGSAQAVLEPTSALVVGVVVIAFTALLFAARSLWWTPLVARIAATVVVMLAVGAGVLLFTPRYYAELGSHPWYVAVPVELALSIAGYAFIGLGATSSIASALRTRNTTPAQSTPPNRSSTDSPP